MQSIGIWGAVLLTLLRSLQGIAVGGEWSGSVLMAGEWARPERRGFTTSFAQMGAPLGLILANGALSVMTVVQDDAGISRPGAGGCRFSAASCWSAIGSVHPRSACSSRRCSPG